MQDYFISIAEGFQFLRQTKAFRYCWAARIVRRTGLATPGPGPDYGPLDLRGRSGFSRLG